MLFRRQDCVSFVFLHNTVNQGKMSVVMPAPFACVFNAQRKHWETGDRCMHTYGLASADWGLYRFYSLQSLTHCSRLNVVRFKIDMVPAAFWIWQAVVQQPIQRELIVRQERAVQQRGFTSRKPNLPLDDRVDAGAVRWSSRACKETGLPEQRIALMPPQPPLSYPRERPERLPCCYYYYNARTDCLNRVQRLLHCVCVYIAPFSLCLVFTGSCTSSAMQPLVICIVMLLDSLYGFLCSLTPGRTTESD